MTLVALVGGTLIVFWGRSLRPATAPRPVKRATAPESEPSREEEAADEPAARLVVALDRELETAPERDLEDRSSRVQQVFNQARELADHRLFLDDVDGARSIYASLAEESGFAELRELAVESLTGLEGFEKRIVEELAPRRRKIFPEYAAGLRAAIGPRDYAAGIAKLDEWSSEGSPYRILGPQLAWDRKHLEALAVGTAADPLSAARIHYYDGAQTGAMREIRAAARKHATEAKVLVAAMELMERIELLREPGAPQAVSKALTEASRLADAGKRDEAAKVLEALRREYRATSAYEAAEPEMQAIFSRIGEPKPLVVASERIGAIDRLAAEAASNREADNRIAQALRDESPQVRSYACKTLGSMDGSRVDRDAVWALMIALDDREMAVGMAAAQALEALGKDRPASIAREKAASKDPTDRHIAALTVSMLPGKDSSSMLARLLKDDSPRVRKTAILGLARLEAKGNAPALLGLLRKEKDPECKLAAAMTLAVFKHEPAVGELLDLVDRHGDSALGGKERLQILSAVAEMAAPRGAPRLKKLLQDHDERVRFHALEGLSRAGAALRTAELKPLAKDPFWRTRALVPAMAARSSEREAHLAVLDLLGDPHPTVRTASQQALARWPDGRAGLTVLIPEMGRLSDEAFGGAAQYAKAAGLPDFGSDVARKREIARQYQEWWTQNGASYKPPGRAMQ